MFRDLQSELMHQRALDLADQALSRPADGEAHHDPPAARPHVPHSRPSVLG